MNFIRSLLFVMMLAFMGGQCIATQQTEGEDVDQKTVRVFIFAGQSNMEGGHSRSQDINRFPPFAGLGEPQENFLYSYNIGREEKQTSNGWVPLQPVNNLFGPELSFARRVSQATGAPIAIIKCAAGGTHLGGDWNPDDPAGFKLYPLALQLVRSSLAELEKKKIPYHIEGFMWHQGENDMFDEEFKSKYEENLKNFLASWRRDLGTPQLRFYIGELCTKTIWGMDNRMNMHAIRSAQKRVIESDSLASYVPTNHDAVEIGGEAGLHYHYGTLGQLEHGVNHADAYLSSIGKKPDVNRQLKTWPYEKGSQIKLFVLAGHRNMEGERAFKQDLDALGDAKELANDNEKIAFKYDLGGGYKTSDGWEPLGPSGYYDTFGPELSFGRALQAANSGNIAIAKFTHSGSQINDWTPTGTEAKDCNLYPQFISFIQESIRELEGKGHQVELAGVFYHLGENDMAYGPYRRNSAQWLQSTVTQSRHDLGMPSLKWFVSQQTPPDDPALKAIDITADLATIAAADPVFIHIKAFGLDPQAEKLVMTASGIVAVGELLAKSYVNQPAPQSIGDIKSPVRIPFTLTAANNISIRAVLNDTEPLQLMFHTAVDSISLTNEAIKELKGFKIDESIDVEAWGGKASSGVSTGNKLRIQNLSWIDQTIFIDEYSGPETDGKFGPNLFAEEVLEINFDRQELVIHPVLPEFVSAPASTYRRVEFSRQPGSMYVVGELAIGESRIKNPFMLHTGFGGTALLDDEFVQTHGLADRLETISERELRDAFGNVVKTRRVRLNMIEFVGNKFLDIPVEIFDGAIGNQKVSVLGGGLIKRFNIVIDPVNDHLYLSPNGLFELPLGD